MASARRTAIIWAVSLILSGTAPARAEDDATVALRRADAAFAARDFATARTVYEAWADRHPAAAFNLGLIYQNALGVARDTKRACDLYQVATRAGIAQAEHNLATCFFSGDGRALDYRKSAEWYQRAAERGLAKSYCALGNQYRDGRGVPEDKVRAAAYCRKGAELGDPDAQTDLGEMYLIGNGVPQSFAEAATWLGRAAEKGQANAAYHFGTMHWNGDGMLRDRDRAAHWYRRAAQGGNRSAPFRLAGYYMLKGVFPAERKIVDEPAAEAAFWYGLAARVDPSPSQRADAAKLHDNILALAPQLRDRVSARLARAVRQPGN